MQPGRRGCDISRLPPAHAGPRGEFRLTCKNPADQGQPGFVECTAEVPPEGFEPSHLAPEASALSPELWGLANGERLPVHSGACDTRAVDDHAP